MLEDVAETIEAFLPDGTAFAEPLLGEAKTFGLDVTRAHAADLFGAHQSAVFEDLKVLYDRGQRDLQRLGKGADGRGAAAQSVDDRPARRVAERMKDASDGVIV